jgi:hypothetical protein
MSYCYDYGPYYYGYQYSPYQSYGYTWGYPAYGYVYPYYGFPLGYSYTLPSPPVFYGAVVPQSPRGEYRVGNCLMICQ